MADNRRSGKLAVILHADVAGSTTLVQQDEHLAHERIQDAFRRFAEMIEKYQGRVCELRGDALLAEFERASDAVVSALAFQIDHDNHNANLRGNIRPILRVGIALGEVVIADNTVTGAGVVLAQRVEQLAESGGVCITGAIHEALPRRMPFDLENLGEQQVKGFDEPVRVYRVALSQGESIPPPQGRRQHEVSPKRRMLIVAATAIVLVVTGGAAYWFTHWVPQEEPASAEHMALPLPDKPSIAVLPFTNMSDDSKQEYFVDGMTEDLITDLSKLKGLFVIARNSTFTYKGKAVKVKQVAKELGVRYVLEGSVRRAGDQVRINAQLIDATSEGHLWAERYDGSLQDIFALQDQVTQQIVAALKINLTGEEQAQQARHATDNADAHDAYLQGWAHYKLGKPEDLARGIPYFEEAVRLDPDYAQAHAALAAVYWNAFQNDWAFDLDMPSYRVESRANDHLEQALKASTPLAHALKSRMLASSGLHPEAVAEAEQAVALDANDATALAGFANALVHAGRSEEGLEIIRRAMRLDPHHPPSYLIILGSAQFGMEHYEVAAVTLERAVKRNPDYQLPLILLASCYGHLGRNNEAEAVIEATNDVRAQAGLGDLSLEKNQHKWWSPFNGEIDFTRFGGSSEQERVRLGLSEISALTWQYLVVVHSTAADGYGAWWEVEGTTEVHVATAKSLYDRGASFVDVSLVHVWAEGHIPGAVNLPYSRSKNAAKRLTEAALMEIVGKTEEVVIYSGGITATRIAAFASAKAINWGFKRVYYFSDGFPAWDQTGYPVEVQ